MSNVLLLIPADPDCQITSALNDGSLKIEKITYESELIEITDSAEFGLIIIVIAKEIDWIYITISRFRDIDIYTPILVVRPDSLRSVDKSYLARGADAIVDIQSSELCFLHRVSSLMNRTFLKPHKQYIFDGETVLDSYSHCLYQNGNKIHLGTQQFKIIEFLALHAGSYFTTYQLLERIGVPSDSAAQSSMRMQIMKLRKILATPKSMPIISTKYRLGYCIKNVRVDTMQ